MFNYKTALFITHCLFILNNVYTQNRFVINYFSTDTSTEEIKPGFYFPLEQARPQYPYRLLPEYKLNAVSYNQTGKISHIRCVYSIGDTSTSMIGDGFGHQFFVIPGDSVEIKFQELTKTNGHYLLNGKYFSSYFHNFSYEGKNKYVYRLFDSLAFYSGSLFWADQRVGLASVGLDLQTYFDTLTTFYKNRIAYLNRYVVKHNVPKIIQELATAEIKASYINNLLNPLTNVVKDYSYDDYPKVYVETLKSMNFIDPNLFFKTHVYNSYSYRYISLFEGKTSFDKEDENTRLKRIYRVIINLNTEKSIKEYLMAAFLIENMKTTDPYIDSALNHFNKQFPESIYVPYVDSLYVLQRSKSKINIDEAMNTPIANDKDNQKLIKNLIKSHPIIIDCWASWCGPCLEQMPYAKEMENKYKGKIDFVYLSFDKDKDKWLNKEGSLLPNEESYLVIENFNSNFANYFDITSIPHYLIFDKNSKLVSSDAPRPSKKVAFEKMMDNLISDIYPLKATKNTP